MDATTVNLPIPGSGRGEATGLQIADAVGDFAQYLDRTAALVDNLLAQPAPARIWAFWLLFITSAAPLPLLWRKETRADGLAVGGAALLIAASMPYWHALVGYTRILGIAHFPVWVPLLVWLYRGRKRYSSPRYVRWTVLLTVVTVSISLLLDGANAVRYLLGERGPL